MPSVLLLEDPHGAACANAYEQPFCCAALVATSDAARERAKVPGILDPCYQYIG